MDLVQVAVTSLVSLAAMFLLTKLMGNKQVSQMNLFDYVIGITVGSIAAEMATELDTPENSLVAMVVYAVAAVCISLWTNKSLGARRGRNVYHAGWFADFDGRRSDLPGESEKGQDGSGGLSYVLPHRGIF